MAIYYKLFWDADELINVLVDMYTDIPIKTLS